MFEIQNYHNNQTFNFHLYDNCYISDTVRQGNIYEQFLHSVFEQYIDENSIVIEGGCHIGLHSVKLSKLSKKLYCFEPLKSSFDLLVKNLQVNKCNNVEIYHNALSDNLTTVNFNWISNGNPGASGLDDNPMGNISKYPTLQQVQTITIDSLQLDNLHFMKLDVEGYEPKAIQGGINTIKKFKPVIALECWSDHKGNASLEYTQHLHKNLIDLGYSVQQISYSDYLFLPL